MNRLNIKFRQRYLLVIPFFIFILSFLTFFFVEKKSILDSLYFIVITLSTVGYGDVTPKNDFSKVVSILLIITGIFSIAYLSEFVINRVIKSRIHESLDLPEKPLNISGHVIIAGYSSIGQKLAKHLSERKFSVIVLEKDEERARLAQLDNIPFVVHADISSLTVLERLSLDKALSLFLCINDDEATIQATLLARSISSDLKIYAKINTHEIDNIINYVGVNRVFHNEKDIARTLRFATNKLERYYFNKHNENKLFEFHEVSTNYKIEDKFQNYYILRKIYLKTRNFVPSHQKMEKNPHSGEYALLLAIPNSNNTSKELESEEVSFNYNRVVIGGYSEYIKDILEHLNIDKENATILVFNENDYSSATKNKFNCILCETKSLEKVLKETVKNGQVLVNLYQKISYALLLNESFKRIKENARIIQVTKYNHERDVFIRSGATMVLSIQEILSRGMFTGFLTENNFKQSIIFDNCHIFEHKVEIGD